MLKLKTIALLLTASLAVRASVVKFESFWIPKFDLV